MTPVYEIFERSSKTYPEYVDSTCEFIKCEIAFTDMKWVKPYPWQQKMLSDILHIARENPDEKELSFNFNQLIGGYNYNILYTLGDVFLMNITTGKTRKFIYQLFEPEPVYN